MVLEAVMVCLDNSEWMRNGDYSPTRFESQNETVNYICNSKIQGNQETTVGLISMAGKRIECHISLGRNLGAIMNALTAVKLSGKSNFLGALKTAQLALKNRQNKNQRPRIVMFVGSPVEDDTKKLVKQGKIFKKNNIAVDVVNFGTENASNENAEKLEAFVNAANSSDNSHLVNIPPGPHVLSDLVLTSQIMVAGGSAPSAGASMGFGGSGMSGLDADVDADLRMALRVSMEEERQRQERLAKEKAEKDAVETAPTETPAASTEAPAAAEGGAEPMDEEDEEEDEEDEDMLAQAIALSMAAAAETAEVPDEDADMGADEQIADEDLQDALQDPDFISDLLGSVDDVNADDISMDDILNKLAGDEKDKKDKS